MALKCWWSLSPISWSSTASLVVTIAPEWRKRCNEHVLRNFNHWILYCKILHKIEYCGTWQANTDVYYYNVCCPGPYPSPNQTFLKLHKISPEMQQVDLAGNEMKLRLRQHALLRHSPVIDRWLFVVHTHEPILINIYWKQLVWALCNETSLTHLYCEFNQNDNL